MRKIHFYQKEKRSTEFKRDYAEIDPISYLQGTGILQASISDHDQRTIDENEEQDDEQI